MASRIEQLAQAIGRNTDKVGNHLRSQGLPFPSFDADGPVEAIIKEPQAEQARQEAMMGCMELLDLLQGPQMCLRPCVSANHLLIIAPSIKTLPRID